MFKIEWGYDLGWVDKYILGFIPDSGAGFSLQNGSDIFLLEFIKKFVFEYPDQAENIIIFSEYGEFSRYNKGISDKELLARIRMEPGHVDRELMTKFGFWSDAYE